MTKCKVIKDQEVFYDDCLFVVEQVFDSLDQAVEYVKEYLNVENPICTFQMFLDYELEYLEFTGSCIMLRGPEEVRGQQPIKIISTRDSDLISDPQTVAQYKLDEESY